jgi:hypothetical protein
LIEVACTLSSEKKEIYKYKSILKSPTALAIAFSQGAESDKVQKNF